MPPSILIVDDHEGVARALGELMAAAGLGPLHLAHDVRSALDAVQSHRPDVVTVDLDLGGDDGFELLARLRGAHRPPPSLVLTASHRPEDVIASLRAGAQSFVPKSASSDELLAAIAATLEGHTWIPLDMVGPVVRRLLSPEPPDDWSHLIASLSKREREVLALLVDGHSRPEVAEALSISLNTVRTHVKNILSKLGVHASIEAVSVALRAGMRPSGAERINGGAPPP